MTLAETLFVDDGPRLRSARAVLRNLFGFSQPDSVIDVGCGDGAWLRAALELDAEAVFGISQGEPQHGLPEDAFLQADLSEPGLDAKIAERLGRKFDLVLALGVAELLPFERSAGFVDELCRLGDTILFSAAIPLQDGYPNEQWTEFWGLHFRRLRLSLLRSPAARALGQPGRGVAPRPEPSGVRAGGEYRFLAVSVRGDGRPVVDGSSGGVAQWQGRRR